MSNVSSLPETKISPIPIASVTATDYRENLTKNWDEVGQLQLDYLIVAGLLPHHKVLDVGCGALRAGGKIINYLNRANYYGIDPEKRLLNAGHLEELRRPNLRNKCPRWNLYCSSMFHHERLPTGTIDFGLFVSVLRDLPLNYMRICLENVAPYFRVGGTLHCSFFEIGAVRQFGQPYTNMARFKTFGFKSPYHYFRRDLENAVVGTAWHCTYFGEWHHPDGEVMMVFEKK